MGKRLTDKKTVRRAKEKEGKFKKRQQEKTGEFRGERWRAMPGSQHSMGSAISLSP